MNKTPTDALLATVLTAWENGVKRWQENHASYPTAFSELAHVMNDVQAHLDSVIVTDWFGAGAEKTDAQK